MSEMGIELIVEAFAVVVIGGLGSMRGAFVAAQDGHDHRQQCRDPAAASLAGPARAVVRRAPIVAPRRAHARRDVDDMTGPRLLVGRVITVVLNGERIIDRQTIPGITGGALDSNEGAPGPILLQGDHGPIEYRNIVVTPAR